MRKLFVLIVILALASLACGISVPKAPQPGPEVTEPIHVDYPDSGEVNLMLTFGAGELILNPGADALVDGTAVYNYAEVKPQIVSDGGDVEVKMGNLKFPSLPTLTDLKNGT